MRVLLALVTVTFALGMVQKSPCVADGWSSPKVRYAAMCYSDVPYLYTGRGFAEHLWPYSDGSRYETMEYPVGISYVAWGVSEVLALAPSAPPQALRAAIPEDGLWSMPGMVREINQYFALTALVMFGCVLAAAWFVASTHRRRPWDALPFVLSPVLLLTGLVNWDLLAVACTAGAVWAWARGKPVWSGVLVGLGVAAKLYPLFLLGAFLVVAWRRRAWKSLGLAAVAAVATWLLVNLPAMAASMTRWKVFWTFNSERGADLGSFWLVLDHLGAHVAAPTINLWSLVLFGVACLAVLVLGLTARSTPRAAQLAFVLVTAFLLVNKVYSPQYVLWLLPLAVLARPSWRDLLIWQAGEVLYFGAVWLYLGNWLQDAGGTASPAYDAAILVRIAAEVYLIGMVVRDVWRGPGPDSPPDDLVEQRRGEPHPEVELVADRGSA